MAVSSASPAEHCSDSANQRRTLFGIKGKPLGDDAGNRRSDRERKSAHPSRGRNGDPFNRGRDMQA
jgi:hypothetical protein